MYKYHNLISMFLGLFFLGLLQTFSKPFPVFRFLVPVFLLFALAISIYNKKYLMSLEKYNFWILFRPLLLLSAGFGMFMLLPFGYMRVIFLLVTAILIFVFELSLGNFAENFLISETIIISYGVLFTIFGLNSYFPFLKTGLLKNSFSMQAVYSVFVFLCVYFLTRAFYAFVPQDSKTQNVSAIILAFFCSQMFWVLTLLPLHFSILALLLTNFYYFCLLLNYYYIFNVLTPKKIYFHFMLIIITSCVALLATPWKVI